MIGASIPYYYMLPEKPLDQAIELLEILKKEKVQSVEFRSIHSGMAPENLVFAAKLIWSWGFSLTIHANVHSVDTCVEEVIPYAQAICALNQQKNFVFVVHPINCEDVLQGNIEMINRLCDAIEEEKLPIKIALENNRLMPDGSEGSSLDLVGNVINSVNRPQAGICFDFGHLAWATRAWSQNNPVIPPKSIAKKIIHTHIHAVHITSEKATTHFPLDENYLPIKEYIHSFCESYYGVYNLELDYPRFEKLVSRPEALKNSIQILRQAVPPNAYERDYVREQYMKDFNDACRVLSTDFDQNAFSLVNSTVYLFSTDGIKWGMDFAMRAARFLTDLSSCLAEKLKNLELMVVTHGHEDHFEYQTVRILKDLDMKWIIPDFLVDTAVEWGLDPVKIIPARCGERITYKTLNFLPFRGRHYRPGTNNGLDEYGYYFSSKTAEPITFPGDVRDYSVNGVPDLPPCGGLFAHVWLGDDAAMEHDLKEYPDAFACFMLAFHPKKVWFAHLNEAMRTNPQMWRLEHAGLCADTIRHYDPSVKSYFLNPGDIILLDEKNVLRMKTLDE